MFVQYYSKCFLYVFLSLAICSALASAQGVELKVHGQDRLICLRNEYIQVEINPQATGRIFSIQYIPQKFELLDPFCQEVVKTGPLVPDRIQDNRRGYCEWLWGRKNRLVFPMSSEVVKQDLDESSVLLKSEFYQQEELAWQRMVSLKKDSTSLLLDVSISNHGEKDNPLSLWLNIVPCTQEFHRVILPVKPVVKPRQGRLMCRPDKQKIICSDDYKLSQLFAAPAQPWIAVVYPKQKIAMAYQVKQAYMDDSGFLYSWFGKSTGQTVRTIEMIFNKVRLQPGEQLKYQFKIQIFAGLSKIQTIAGALAIDFELTKSKNSELVLTFATSEMVTAQDCHLTLIPIDTGDSEIILPIQKIPSFKPGQTQQVTWVMPKSIHGKSYRVKGQLDVGLSFEFLDTIKP